MHKTHYRPSRSQQLLITSLIPKKDYREEIVVHHVLEDSYSTLLVQIERRLLGKVTFERINVR